MSLIKSVPDTAFMVATYRATESERPDALFHDPLAAGLAGERGRRIAERVRWRHLADWSVTVRTVVIDALIEAAVAAGADTVLNLGAGLDTRPYRMNLPSKTWWIEVDYPQVIALKECRLAPATPRCELERVKLDLLDVEARRRLLARIEARASNVMVVTEGVIPYLSADDVGALADDLGRTNAVRAWIVDYFSPATLWYRKRMAREFKNAPFKFAPKDWLGFFSAHGWVPKEKRYLADEGARLGRPLRLPPALRASVAARWLLMSQARRESLRRFAGYFVMEPVRGAPDDVRAERAYSPLEGRPFAEDGERSHSLG